MLLCLGAPVRATTLVPDTGATLDSSDPNWSVLWRPVSPSGTSVGALAHAPLVSSIPSPPWQPNVAGVNNWLGVNAAATIPDAPGDGSRRYEYAFTTAISLPAAQTVRGAIGYDNFFVGGFVDGSFDAATGTYTPGTQFASPLSLLGAGNENKSGFCRDGDGFLPSSSFSTCTVNFAFALPAGDYKLTLVVQGDGVTDGFILNQQGVTLVPEPVALAWLGPALLAALQILRSRPAHQGSRSLRL
jgi:hypothetical protein